MWVFQDLNAWCNTWLSFSLFLSFSVSASSLLPCMLPQKVTGQQQEINNLVERRTIVDEEKALMKKELTALREQLVNKSQELQVGGTDFQWQSGLQSRKVSSVWHWTRQVPRGFSHRRLNHLEEKDGCSALLNTIFLSFHCRSVSPFLAFSYISHCWQQRIL